MIFQSNFYSVILSHWLALQMLANTMNIRSRCLLFLCHALRCFSIIKLKNSQNFSRNSCYIFASLMMQKIVRFSRVWMMQKKRFCGKFTFFVCCKKKQKYRLKNQCKILIPTAAFPCLSQVLSDCTINDFLFS
jgi:hypothetical protein